MIRERVAILSDSPVRGLDVGRFERRLADDKGVDDDAERPDIDFIRVTALAFEHFGCDVVRSTANSSLLFTVKVELRRQTEIAQLDLHLVVEEKIPELQVAMDDSVLVKVLQGINDLRSVALNFQLVEALTPFEELVHALILAKLEEDVYVLAVLEEVLEVAHVVMLDTSMNLDLAHELLFGAAFRQAGLLDDLGCMDESCVGIDEFVAFCEATLTKELALDVSSNANLSAIFLEFFFNYGLGRGGGARLVGRGLR